MSIYQILLNGQGADADLYTAVSSLEVEENLDLPAAVQLTLPVVRTDSGDLTYVSDSRFQPLVNLAVVVTPGGAPGSGSAVSALRPGLWAGEAAAGQLRSVSSTAIFCPTRCIWKPGPPIPAWPSGVRMRRG